MKMLAKDQQEHAPKSNTSTETNNKIRTQIKRTTGMKNDKFNLKLTPTSNTFDINSLNQWVFGNKLIG